MFIDKRGEIAMKYFEKEEAGGMVFILTSIKGNKEDNYFFFKKRPEMGVVHRDNTCLCANSLRGTQSFRNLSEEEEIEAYRELCELVEESKDAPQSFVFMVRHPEFYVKEYDGGASRGIDEGLCEYVDAHQWSEALSFSYRSREEAEEALEEYILQRLKETGLLEEATQRLFKQQG